MKQKLQIFISSTFIDLQDERQAAVEAVLGSNNIPAGMELFKAGNKSQWETIQKWINESDIYMLILGGRYGSIEKESGKSYTQLEYEYALKRDIPVFAIVLKTDYLNRKNEVGDYLVFENENKYAYDKFKETVMSKMVKEVDDVKDIKLAVYESITELKDENNFLGWVRGDALNNSTEILNRFSDILKENEKLKIEIDRLKDKNETNIFDEGADDDFVSEKTNIPIHGSKDYGDTAYREMIPIDIKEVINLICPGILVYKRIREAKEYLEEVVKDKYRNTYYTLNIGDNWFETMKVKLYSKNIIEINDEIDEERIKVSMKGKNYLFRIKSEKEK